MRISVIGGLDRREKEYMQTFKILGMNAKIITKLNCNFDQSIKCSQCVVLLTALCSHNMANKAKKVCKKNGIPIVFIDKKSPDAVSSCMREYMDCSDCELFCKCKRGN